MSDALPRLLAVALPAAMPALDGFTVDACPGVGEATARLAGEHAYAAIVVDGDATACSALEVEAFAAAAALVVVLLDPDADHASAWMRRGADDVLGRAELLAGAAPRRLRFAIERRARVEGRLHAYATDASTGLPHRQQLIEHLSQLLALREREPAPMALLALRIDGAEAAGPAAEGAEVDEASDAEAQALRRKIAVRLRAGVRASDVVAAVESDRFVVLLGSLLAPADAERVAAKLVAALAQPFKIGSGERSVAVAAGISRFPDDGKTADRLLRRALALAEAAPLLAAEGPLVLQQPGSSALRTAANDEA